MGHNLFNVNPNIFVSHQKCIEDDPCTKFLHLKKQCPINSTIFYTSYATLFWYLKCQDQIYSYNVHVGSILKRVLM